MNKTTSRGRGVVLVSFALLITNGWSGTMKLSVTSIANSEYPELARTPS